MTNSATNASISGGFNINDPSQIFASFKRSVVDLFSIRINGRTLNYQEYLALPKTDRSDDEADAVDKRFADYALRWLGFDNEDDWNYNRPQSGRKANRPDYSVNASIGKAFIWEDKNSTIDLEEDHLKQMRRYSVDTAGYAVWCNMRRILAIRFLPSDRLNYEILADIPVYALFEAQKSLEEQEKSVITNLALFRLLFEKERFTQFKALSDKIAIREDIFKKNAISLIDEDSKNSFIDGSRQSLDHLALAALILIRKALESHERLDEEEKSLSSEWERELMELKANMAFEHISRPVVDMITTKLTPRLGEIKTNEISQVRDVLERLVGSSKFTVSLNTAFEKWKERAIRINNAFLVLRFQLSDNFKISDAYKIWYERQSDKADAKPEVFAEQVAYVFFIRLLLVRILEDKEIVKPRLASDGGFDDWRKYVESHFKELKGVGILNQNYCSILTRKAGNYYLHFFQQAVFDWFIPDDFLLIETLEFLCRYDFQKVASDIIGFTYEEYIQKVARKRKGHFLTRDDVVEYMLDVLGYEGLHILGRRVFDPACGSGSFLVHASNRYRQALIASFCLQYNALNETALFANETYRKEFARRYLDDLSNLFFGMELNPFACYLAEMNMLIQGLDDLSVLQESGENHPIDRFQIFNTDSLDLPREILDSTDTSNTGNILWSPNLSDYMTDESFPIKAKSDSYAQGFFFILSNPPYINASQVSLGKEYGSFQFYSQALSGALNTYLLFLRLGMYYLGTGGRMIYIIPLTIIGDASAAAVRRLLKQAPFKSKAVVRFFSGNILFPGVDQAVAIICIDKSTDVDVDPQDWQVYVSGGHTVEEARQSYSKQRSSLVFESTPATQAWQSAWLVSNDANSYRVWDHVKNIAKDTLGDLWEKHLEVRQGDVRSDHVQSFYLGKNHQPTQGDIAVQKGEDLFRYAPLARKPSDWARPITGNISDNRKRTVNNTLLRIQQLTDREEGITLRKVARLNTRETLIATWFQRDKNNPFVFPDEQWRFRLLPEGDLTVAKGLLALFNSRIVAYLLNLFSTNNNVAQGELARLLIPDKTTFPANQLAILAGDLLKERLSIDNEFVLKYGAKLPDMHDGVIYISPSKVLLKATQLQKLSLGDWVIQGLVRNQGDSHRKIRSLRDGKQIEYIGNDATSARVLSLFLDEVDLEEDSWTQAQRWLLPDTVATTSWLRLYDSICKEAQESWNRFVLLQEQVDVVVADWYAFDPDLRDVIIEGLPWVRRRRGSNKNDKVVQLDSSDRSNLLALNDNSVSVTSRLIYSIAYDDVKRILIVELQSGDTYAYHDVPTKLYEDFKIASSKGKYYSEVIKGKYDSYRL